MQREGEQKVVFVVDDDHWVRETLQMALADEGYRVVLAADGRDALDRLDTVSHILAMMTRSYSWTTRFRMPMTSRQGTSGRDARVTSERRRLASPMTARR